MENAGSEYAVAEILNWMAGKVDPDAVSAGRYLALFETNPNNDGSGTELSGGSYARVSCASAFTSISSGASTIANTGTIAFPTATADWNTAYYWALYDNSSGGNIVTYGWIPAGLTVLDTQSATFAIGSVVITAS